MTTNRRRNKEAQVNRFALMLHAVRIFHTSFICQTAQAVRRLDAQQTAHRHLRAIRHGGR